MVQSAQRLVPVLVDCSERGANEALMRKYQVQGFPTVIYVDPEGKPIQEMGSRDAAAIVREIEQVSRKYPGRPSLWLPSLKTALEVAKRGRKPVAVYLADPKTDLVALTARLLKDLGDRKTKFLWVVEFGRPEALQNHGVEAAPAVVVIDPKSGEPAARIAVKPDDKADVLNKALDEAAQKIKK